MGLALLAGCASERLFTLEDRWPTPRGGMVVSEHPLATRAGASILERGGNAADAAVATALALAVVYPQAGNLGGGGFALWVPHDPNSAQAPPAFLDFRETAPARLSAELFLDPTGMPDPTLRLGSSQSVGVPGSPAGLHAFHARYGELSFAEVAAPAIRLARDGFPVDAHLARDLAQEAERARLERGAARELFYPGGAPLAQGDRLVQPALARTLELLVESGPEPFYSGEIALLLEQRLSDTGVLDRGDLARYDVVWRAPLVGWFRGLEVLTAPPPSSGGVVLLQTLAMLDGFPLDEEARRTREARLALGESAPSGVSARGVHFWIEALRCAFADRAAHLADPAFHDVPLEELLAPEWIEERRTKIGENARPEVRALELPTEGGATTHLSVLDSDGNAVALTTTLNTTFGSGIYLAEAGFLLNNEMDDFVLRPGVANANGLAGELANGIEPGKRPLSSMTPTVVRDGGKVVRMVLGSPGGPRIVTAVLQVILRTEVYGETLEEAVAAPRLHQQWNPARTVVEPGWDPLLLETLRGRGHEIEEGASFFASVQAIRVDVGAEPIGASDPRRGGSVELVTAKDLRE
jgi:gamma-glutamyltranspeptidase/glutathione hydrolase